MDDATTIHIGDRTFKPLTIATAERDVFVRAAINRSGLQMLHKLDEETTDAFALRILGNLYGNGEVFALLGGLMMSADIEESEWSPQMAEDTARFLRRLTNPKDKRAVMAQISALVAGFITAGLTLLKISPKSLAELRNRQRVSPKNPNGDAANSTANGPNSFTN
jgi:hypothetical protein